MKQNFFIILGLILIFLLVGAWVYVLFFKGTPAGMPTLFPEGDGRSFPTDAEESRAPLSNTDLVFLERLTDKPVATAVFLDDSVRFLERGTGYVYDVALSSGAEMQITNTTIPRVVEGVFSSSGNRVVVVVEEAGGTEALLGTITKNDRGEGTLSGTGLPSGAKNFSFSDSGEALYYFVPSESGGSGYEYVIPEQTQTRLFSVPLSYLEVLWGDPTFAYTTPTYHQRGYLYEIAPDGELEYVLPSEPGLVATRFHDTFFVTNALTGTESLFTQVLRGATASSSPIRLIPEKCAAVGAEPELYYCGVPEVLPRIAYPDDWYKGLVSFSDNLWLIDVSGSEVLATLMFDVSNYTTEQFDIAHLASDKEGERFVFINKRDGGLWLYTPSGL